MKKMMFIIPALALALLFTCVIAARAESDEMNPGLICSFDEKTGTLTLTCGEGFGGTVYGYEPEVGFRPAWYGYTDKIKHVVVNEGVTNLTTAFENLKNLKSVTLPDSLTSIGYEAFYGCSSLSSVKIPDGVTSIGGEAFCGCESLKEIKLPNGVKEIAYRAFAGCKNLSKITFGSGLQTVSMDAFEGCEKLGALTLPASVTHITGYNGEVKAINVSPDNETYASVNGTLYSKDMTVLYRYNTALKDKSFAVPDTVKTVGNYAFAYSRLETVGLPDGLTSIGNYAFYMCEKLTTATIPDSVKEAGACLFYSCDSLDNVTVGSGLNMISQSMFACCRSLKNVTFKANNLNFGSGVFSHCTSLTEFTFTQNTAKIDYGGIFYGCESLTKITFDRSFDLGAQFYKGCPALSDIVFAAENDSHIFADGVLYANGGKDVAAVLPSYESDVFTVTEDVEKIYGYAFCLSNVKKVMIKGRLKLINDFAYTDSDIVEVIFEGPAPEEFGFPVINHRLEMYYDPSYRSWNVLKEYTPNGNGVWIPLETFNQDSGKYGDNISWEYDDDLKLLKIGGEGRMRDTLDADDIPWKFLSDQAEYVIVEDGIDNITQYAFYGFEKLQHIVLPALDAIFSKAFYGCDAVKTVSYQGILDDWLRIRFVDEYSDPTRGGALLATFDEPDGVVLHPTGTDTEPAESSTEPATEPVTEPVTEAQATEPPKTEPETEPQTAPDTETVPEVKEKGLKPLTYAVIVIASVCVVASVVVIIFTVKKKKS